MSQFDVTLRDCGSIIVFKPVTDEAKAWVDKHIPEDTPQWCGGVAVEPRYANDVIVGLRMDGLEVGLEQELL